MNLHEYAQLLVDIVIEKRRREMYLIAHGTTIAKQHIRQAIRLSAYEKATTVGLGKPIQYTEDHADTTSITAKRTWTAKQREAHKKRLEREKQYYNRQKINKLAYQERS